MSKNDKLSALRHLVPEIENELKDRLFDPQNPFTNQDGIVDQQIMIDCLRASFRLNSRNVIWSLFPICLQDDAPSIFKLVLVKSCLQIGMPADLCSLQSTHTLNKSYRGKPSPLEPHDQCHVQQLGFATAQTFLGFPDRQTSKFIFILKVFFFN